MLTFAGIAGLSKTCRNRAHGFWNNTVLPAVGGLDFFDTVQDSPYGSYTIPQYVPPWTVINSNDYGDDFACGGIYSTGNTTTGNTGADATVAHDANGNWQDLTPNYAPGGTSADNVGGGDGCNDGSKFCVFKELISGLMVTKVSSSTYLWEAAITYCDNLGGTGGVITDPIPAIGGGPYSDWRLPTQKEMLQLYQGGINGLNPTNALSGTYGYISQRFWSSTTNHDSFGNGTAWWMDLGQGEMAVESKAGAFRAVCVR